MVREACETGAIEVYGQRLVRCAQGVDSHVELLAADQQGVTDVALDDVWLGLGAFRFPSEVILPLCNLLKLV